MATIVRSAKKEGETLVWDRPFRVSLEPGIPRDRLLPQVVGHFWMREGEERANLHGLGGPMRWPLRAKGGGREVLWVHDRCGPAGADRRTSGMSFEDEASVRSSFCKKVAVAQDSTRRLSWYYWLAR